METTEQKLQAILSEIEDAPLREDLFNNFHMRNPLEFARVLVALDISDSIKSQLLACKVSAKQKYNGEGLDVLIERAAQLMWARLGEEQV
jgi:hypothetical protein